VSRPI